MLLRFIHFLFPESAVQPFALQAKVACHLHDAMSNVPPVNLCFVWSAFKEDDRQHGIELIKGSAMIKEYGMLTSGRIDERRITV